MNVAVEAADGDSSNPDLCQYGSDPSFADSSFNNPSPSDTHYTRETHCLEYIDAAWSWRWYTVQADDNEPQQSLPNYDEGQQHEPASVDVDMHGLEPTLPDCLRWNNSRAPRSSPDWNRRPGNPMKFVLLNPETGYKRAKNPRSKQEKKDYHVNIERRRRESMSVLFDRLTGLVPSLQTGLHTKLEVLQRAAAFLEQLQRTNTELEWRVLVHTGPGRAPD